MDFLLTDHLVCPRCGPEFGLVLLAREIRDRRVLSGELGCANCRERYPVREGVADLRPPPRSPPREPEAPAGPSPDREAALRLGALLGTPTGPGRVLLWGSAAPLAPLLAELVEGLEIVASGPAVPAGEVRRGLSRLLVEEVLPLRSHVLRGAGLGGGGAPLPETLVAEAVRCVVPGGRIVLLDAGGDAAGSLEAAGVRVVLREAEVAVGVREP